MSNTSLNEFDELFDSVYPKQINLKSFDKKKNLNPAIWSHGQMKKIIRKHLEIIAKNFIKEIEDIPVKIADIVIVGSIAGYNWSKFSDIDLHIMVDFDALSKYGNRDTLKTLFDLKKNAWNKAHDIHIYGYPVEIYIQDINEENASDGIYSVKYKKWNKIPEGGSPIEHKDIIKTQASQYINIIDKIEELAHQNYNKKQLRILKNELEKIHDEIVMGRRNGLKTDDKESSTGNIVFKVLRRTRHLDKIREISVFLYDKIQSL